MNTTFAKSLFTAAAEVEAAETNIKHAILAAAETGDMSRITNIVTRWLSTPPVEVLASMELDPCERSEVPQAEHPRGGAGRTTP